MASIPKLFMSHSSRDRDQTRELADELARLDSVELLLDEERLQPGYHWEPDIHEYMARCDAGLLLLTEEVLRRPDYVRKEATVLAWRAALDTRRGGPARRPAFPFFIVAEAHLRPSEEPAEQDGPEGPAPDAHIPTLDEAGFGPLGLHDVQWLDTTEPAEVAEQVDAVMAGHVISDTPFDRVVHQLRDLLVRAGPEAVRSVAARLDTVNDPLLWDPAQDELQRDAEHIARHVLAGKMGPYGLTAAGTGGAPAGLSELAGDLRLTTNREDLVKILTLVAPHWVDGNAAGLFALLPAQEPRRALAVNGRRVGDYTAQMFLWRGHLDRAPHYYILGVAGGNPGNMLAHYTRQICDAFRTAAGEELVPDTNKTIAAMRILRHRRMHVVLVPPFPDGRDLDVLLERFPNVNVVLAMDDHSDLPTGSARIDVAEPAVDPEVEERAYWDFKEAIRPPTTIGW